VVLPGPQEIFTRTLELAASLRRVISGFLLGAALTIRVGFLMSWYARRALIELYVQFFRMIPLAILTLAFCRMPLTTIVVPTMLSGVSAATSII